MNPQELWNLVTGQLFRLADHAAGQLAGGIGALGPEPSAAGTPLEGRLLTAADAIPAGDPLVTLVREMLGDLSSGSPVRLHGWQRAPGAQRGVALVATDPAGGRAVLAVSPGGPAVDIVVTPGASVSVDLATGPWHLQAAAASSEGWDVSVAPGSSPVATTGTARVTLERAGPLKAGLDGGPGVSVGGVAVTVTAEPGAPASVEVKLPEFTAAALPPGLAELVGAAASTPLTAPPSAPPVTLRADRAGGLRFAGNGGMRADLPLRLDRPGIRTRDAGVELTGAGGALGLSVVVSLAAALPGLPLNATIDRMGITLPVPLKPDARLGFEPGRVNPLFPERIGVQLALPPVSGSGTIGRNQQNGEYSGLITIDLGVLRLEAVGLLLPPTPQDPATSFLVILSAQFPPPGLQLGFGFALDAVGGLVGVNRRVDITALTGLVSDGNADRVLFPADATGRAGEIVTALSAAFPKGRGRFLIGPMVRLTWSHQLVSLSGAVVLEMPAPVQAVFIGRLLVAVPHPAVPLIRLQAGVLGRMDPGEPVVEVLASLAGSWIVGLALSGEIYVLFRGGDRPEFVVSAGGFHPRFNRPPGVPALQRLQLDLAPGGGWGLRAEAYLAVTSNSLQFGGRVQLDAMIAGCGVEGWLGLDALCVFEPFAFSVRVYAGVAVRAFGRRLASVGLDFTLEGPAPWHAFGTGSISVLFWDVELDFDIHWGLPPARGVAFGAGPQDRLREVIGRTEAWVVQRPAAERLALTFTKEAAGKLDKGELVHPDATLRVSQSVVPLGVPIDRYQRLPVPPQTWIVKEVGLGAGPLDVKELDAVPERFVPGEFFAMNEEQQLATPGFVTRAGGLRLATDGLRMGTGHRVDDTYETGYKPPPRPEEPQRDRVPWIGLFGRERILLRNAGERLERWRVARSAVEVRPVSLAVADVRRLRPVLEDVSLVAAGSDAWQALKGRMEPGLGVELVERWELPV